jgi:xanthine dehydrogenase large subunit
VALWPEANREDTVFGSKAVGEPPLMLAISVFEALKDAIAAARAGQRISLTAPATAENVLKALGGAQPYPQPSPASVSGTPTWSGELHELET